MVSKPPKDLRELRVVRDAPRPDAAPLMRARHARSRDSAALNDRSSSGTRRISGWMLGAAIAVFAAVSAAAATSDATSAAVDAIVEVLTDTPPPALPPAPTLPAGAPVAERRVFLKPPGEESKVDPRAPASPKAFSEPTKVATRVADGPLPERVRAGREDPVMCSVQCQLTANAALQQCDGYRSAEEIAGTGGARPLSSCRKDLIGIYQSCLQGCGIELPKAVATIGSKP